MGVFFPKYFSILIHSMDTTNQNNSSDNLPQVLTNAVSAIHDRQQTNQNIPNGNGTTTNTTSQQPAVHDIHKWQNTLSFWVLGMCNNYGYVVMLSAAIDIINRFNRSMFFSAKDIHYTEELPFGISRECVAMSAGVLLLADTIPGLSVSVVAPFLPFYINVRMTLAVLMSATGFIIVATAQHQWHAILGIVITSFSSGLGETSMIAYTSKFNRNSILAWSSGTGAAGVAGALTYALLKYMKVSPEKTLLMMLFVPLIQFLTFFIILREPHDLWATLPSPSSTTSLIDHNTVVQPEIQPVGGHAPLTFAQKIDYLPNLLKYVLPLFSVYLCEYFINQGLLDLIYFDNIQKWLDRSDQYCWLQVTYQIGVFISRSSLSLFSTDQIWLMSILQFFNVLFFTYQAIFMVIPNIWIIIGIVFWEGLLGGCCYVNTFNRISKELPMEYKCFGLGLTTIGQSCGVVLAGLLAIPIHNVICNLPDPKVLK